MPAGLVPGLACSGPVLSDPHPSPPSCADSAGPGPSALGRMSRFWEELSCPSPSLFPPASRIWVSELVQHVCVCVSVCTCVHTCARRSVGRPDGVGAGIWSLWILLWADGICLVSRSPHMPSDSSALPVPWGGGSGSVFAFPGGLT